MFAIRPKVDPFGWPTCPPNPSAIEVVAKDIYTMKRSIGIAALAALVLSLSFSALRADAAPGPLLKRGSTITIPGSTLTSGFSEIDTVHHRLLGGHDVDGTADIYDLDGKTLAARVEAENAVDIAFVPKLDKYFASGSDEQVVLVFDAKTLKDAEEIKIPGDTDAILYDPKNDRVYVANYEGSHVWAIDPNTQKIVDDIHIDGAPGCMVYDPAADRIYLNGKATDEIYVIDPNAKKVVATWPIKPVKGPGGLAFDPKTNRLFAAGANSLMAVVDASTGKLITTVEIAPGAAQSAFDPGTSRVYSAGPGQISVVQETPAGAEFLGNVPTQATAKNVAVDPKTHSVWTCYTDGKDAYAQEFTP